MKTFSIRSIMMILAVVIGFLIGELYRAGRPDVENDQSGRDHLPDTKAHQLEPRSHASAFLQTETKSLWVADDFDDDIKRRYRETKSPLRTGAALSFHVQERSFDEWAILLENGQILRPDLLREVGERLADLDPVRALDILLGKRSYRLANMDQYYAFRSGLLQTVARQYPEIGLKALQDLERGGVQMDNSLYYSSQLAWFTPEVAVDHFDELVELRNMKMEGSADLPRDQYADAIMESWLNKDEESAISYTENLPEGPMKQALQKSIEKRTAEEK